MSTSPVTNGPSSDGKFIDRIDPDDPEYIRQMRRPADVKEDINFMDDRKRVNNIMTSKAFREQLEQLWAEQLRSGPHGNSLLALQQMTELVMPQYKLRQSSLFSRLGGAAIPISDIRGAEAMAYSKSEKVHRCKTASLYRLADLFGMACASNSLITTRLSQDTEHLLAAPHGLLYSEVTAGNLVKVDMGGQVVDSGFTGLGVNDAAFSVHAAVHASRPDIKCVMQLRNTNATALSSLKTGLMPIGHEAISLGDVSYYDIGGSLDNVDSDTLARTLGPSNKVLVLRHYGVMVGGQTVEETFYLSRNLMAALEIQYQMMPLGVDNILLPSDEQQRAMFEASKQRAKIGDDGRRKWRRGEMEFEALMRQLDNAGYRTGHVYHEPLLKKERRGERANSEVEIPPSVSSYHAGGGDDGISPLTRIADAQKKQHKTEWLNTPNTYKREEIAEVGTPNPKKITKWVPEGSSTGSTPVKVENPNQFAPQGSNPKEYKQKFKEIKKEYYEEKIDAGPQSRVLEGRSWDEVEQMKESSGQSDSVVVVGAASKGIIQRDHQHNAVVYKQTYAANPFSGVSEDDVEKYKQEVNKSATPAAGDVEGDELVPGPDGKLISTEERLQQLKMTSQDDSAIQAKRQMLEQSLDFQRSKSERKPSKSKRGVNGDHLLASPTKSTSSQDGGATHDERSSREASPQKEPGASGDVMSSPEKHSVGASGDKSKKSKKFRMPSFSKTKDKKVKEKKSAKQSQV